MTWTQMFANRRTEDIIMLFTGIASYQFHFQLPGLMLHKSNYRKWSQHNAAPTLFRFRFRLFISQTSRHASKSATHLQHSLLKINVLPFTAYLLAVSNYHTEIIGLNLENRHGQSSFHHLSGVSLTGKLTGSTMNFC